MNHHSGTESGAFATSDQDQDQLWSGLASAREASEYFESWLALQCAMTPGTRCGLLLLQDDSGTFVPAAVWSGGAGDITALADTARRSLMAREGIVEQPDRGAAAGVRIAYPLELGTELLGVAVLELLARDEVAVQDAMRRLHWGSGRIEALLARRRLDGQTESLARSGRVLDLAVRVGEHAGTEPMLLQLANELAATQVGLRVAVGLVRGRRVRLRALSTAAWFDEKSDFTRGLENAMDEALDQGRVVQVCPPGAVDPGPPSGTIAIAHRALPDAPYALTVPMLLRGRRLGAVTLLSQQPIAATTQAFVEASANLLAPELDLRRELDRWWAGRTARLAAQAWQRLRDPRRPAFLLGLLGGVVLLALLALMEVPFRVAGKAVVEGEVQRALVAPFDGFVAQASVRAGHRVRKGDELARLDDRDLQLERRKWLSEREQAERKYRDALARHDRANVRILEAQYAEANAQFGLAEERIARARLLAPFDGVVISGDLSQMLGSPVEKGKVLFEVAPLDTWRVVVKVPEVDVRYLTVGQEGVIRLAGMPEHPLPFRVRNLGVAVAEEGENLFRVEAQLEATPPEVRPGMEGVGKVSIGERRLLWVWTRGLLEWLSLKLWQWTP